MWLYMVYCVAASLNACHGVYATEGSPSISTSFETQEKCQEEAIKRARSLKAEDPTKDIRWKCVDYSNVDVSEDKR